MPLMFAKPEDRFSRVEGHLTTTLLTTNAGNQHFMISRDGTNSRLSYSKACVKRPLKKRQNKDLNDKWSKILQNAFYNTFDLH